MNMDCPLNFPHRARSADLVKNTLRALWELKWGELRSAARSAASLREGCGLLGWGLMDKIQGTLRGCGGWGGRLERREWLIDAPRLLPPLSLSLLSLCLSRLLSPPSPTSLRISPAPPTLVCGSEALLIRIKSTGPSLSPSLRVPLTPLPLSLPPSPYPPLPTHLLLTLSLLSHLGREYIKVDPLGHEHTEQVKLWGVGRGWGCRHARAHAHAPPPPPTSPKKGLSFISSRQRRKEGTFRASGLAGIEPTPARSVRASHDLQW